MQYSSIPSSTHFTFEPQELYFLEEHDSKDYMEIEVQNSEQEWKEQLKCIEDKLSKKEYCLMVLSRDDRDYLDRYYEEWIERKEEKQPIEEKQPNEFSSMLGVQYDYIMKPGYKKQKERDIKKLQDEIQQLKEEATHIRMQMIQQGREEIRITEKIQAKTIALNTNTMVSFCCHVRDKKDILLYNPIKKRMIKQYICFPWYTYVTTYDSQEIHFHSQESYGYSYIQAQDVLIDCVIDYQTGKEYVIYKRGKEFWKQEIGGTNQRLTLHEDSPYYKKWVKEQKLFHFRYENDIYQRIHSTFHLNAFPSPLGYGSIMKCIIYNNHVFWLYINIASCEKAYSYEVKDKIRLYEESLKMYSAQHYNVINERTLITQKSIIPKHIKYKKCFFSTIRDVQMDHRYNIYYKQVDKTYVDHFLFHGYDYLYSFLKDIRGIIMEYL